MQQYGGVLQSEEWFDKKAPAWNYDKDSWCVEEQEHRRAELGWHGYSLQALGAEAEGRKLCRQEACCSAVPGTPLLPWRRLTARPLRCHPPTRPCLQVVPRDWACRRQRAALHAAAVAHA